MDANIGDPYLGGGRGYVGRSEGCEGSRTVFR